jgi:hypothetical protein
MCNKARVEGCIVEVFTCKEITNFSSKYFSRTNNMNTHTTWYHIVEEVLLSELSIFQWKGKGVGAPSAHYIMDEEWNYTMIYMYMKMEEVQPYFDMFDKIYWKQSEQPTLKQLDFMRRHGVKGGPSFTKWFCLHVILHFAPFFFSNCCSCITHIICNTVCSFICSACMMSMCLMTVVTWLGESIGI